MNKKENLTFEKIFSNEMVLPQNKEFKIAGHANAGEKVSVIIENTHKESVADENGSWSILFAPMKVKRCTIVANTSTEHIEINNVRFGKVYLLAGQSNIEYKLRDDQEYSKILAHFNPQNAYFYNVPKIEFKNIDGSVIPDDLPEPSWQQISKETIGEMSAIGFFMLEQLLQKDPRQTIGIIDCYKGGTSASSWIAKEALENDSELKKTFITPFKNQIFGKSEADFKGELVDYQKSVNVHNTKLAEYMEKNPNASLSVAKDTVGHTPWPPPMTPKSFLRPSGLYENMVLSVKNYTFNDVVWYQGENDAPNPQVYEKLLKILIQNWRSVFNDQSLPFYIVQLPGYADEPKDAWAMIRQAQLVTVKDVPYTHLISIADTGDEHNIHPASKRKAGTRIGQIVSGLQYGSTPWVNRIEYQNGELILTVSQASSLRQFGNCQFKVLRNNEWQSQEILNIQGNQIVIKDKNRDIEAIQYEYENYPKLTLFNEIDYPVAPFKFGFEYDID